MKSWKTSLMGFLGAAMQAYMGGMSWRSIATATPTLLLGLLAKDADVSGQHPIFGPTTK